MNIVKKWLHYTTNPTERSAAAERSTSESDLESPVESEHSLGGILQMVLDHFRSLSAR